MKPKPTYDDYPTTTRAPRDDYPDSETDPYGSDDPYSNDGASHGSTRHNRDDGADDGF
ncbi:MAG TPA: hypothetical protein VGH89_35250 [Pseudonocardia sp.]